MDCQTIDNNKKDICPSLKSFRTLVIGIMTIQSTFVIVTLSLTVNIQSQMAAQSESLMQLKTRQEIIEQKADDASSDAARALAISGKAESNIAWIREGLTELKIALRDDRYNDPRKFKNIP